MKRILSFTLALIMLFAFTAAAFAAQIPYLSPDESIAVTGAQMSASSVGVDWSGEVPKIEINTADGNGTTLQKADGYVSAQIAVTDVDGSALNGAVSFKVRGNSTAMESVLKKAFTFKFEKKTNVLGMGKAKKWALIANCFDPTLLRNYVVFDFAKELGLPYTSEQRIVELWLDGEYRGCYTLYEPVQAGAARVDIDVEGDGGKKDFMIEYEASRVEEDVTYLTVSGLRFAVSEPENPDEDQIAYIRGVITDIINTLKNGSEEDIRQKMDVNSFAAYYLLNEYAKTKDFEYSSVFFFYKNGVLYAGPPWDYDLSLGNLNSSLNSSTAKAASVSDGVMQTDKNIYRYLCNKDWFLTEVKRVYAQHYDYIARISADGGLLDTLRSEYAAVFDRNFSVWRVNKWWLNYQRPPLATYDENYQLLKNWCAERNCWLTDYYGLTRYDFTLGDADGNGTVDVTDVTVIQRILADLRTDDDGLVAVRAALSGGALMITDATMIQRYLAEMKVPYPLNEPTSIMLYE